MIEQSGSDYIQISFWPYGETILSDLGVLKMYYSQELNEGKSKDIIYFVTHCTDDLKDREIRAVSFDTIQETYKIYFWCSSEDFEIYINAIPPRCIREKGEWSDDGNSHYVIIGQA